MKKLSIFVLGLLLTFAYYLLYAIAISITIETLFNINFGIGEGFAVLLLIAVIKSFMRNDSITIRLGKSL